MTAPVDYQWVLEMTFIVTVVVGVPIIALTSLLVDLPTWTARVTYATSVAAAVWLLTAVVLFGYAWRVRSTRGGDGR